MPNPVTLIEQFEVPIPIKQPAVSSNRRYRVGIAEVRKDLGSPDKSSCGRSGRIGESELVVVLQSFLQLLAVFLRHVPSDNDIAGRTDIYLYATLHVDAQISHSLSEEALDFVQILIPEAADFVKSDQSVGALG
jgi:hypothetical protein